MRRRPVVLYLRVDPELRDALIKQADDYGVSVNTYATVILARASNVLSKFEQISSALDAPKHENGR